MCRFIPFVSDWFPVVIKSRGFLPSVFASTLLLPICSIAKTDANKVHYNQYKRKLAAQELT